MNKLLEKLKEQRKYFIRDADGNKIITNHLLYSSLEEELLKIQEEISLENKRIIAKELGCDVKSIYKFVHKECQKN